MNDKALEEDGRRGEEELLKWLDENGFSYLYIGQDRKTFPHLFKGNVKRPDFLVLIDSIGLIAVDAKNYKKFNGNFFSLRFEEEVRRTIAFERLFRIPMWYAFRDKKSQECCWYWISALKALEVGEMRENRTTQKGTRFLSLEIKHFTKIVSKKDFGKLYTQSATGYSGLKELPYD